MEKRFTIALILSLAVLVLWQVFVMPGREESETPEPPPAPEKEVEPEPRDRPQPEEEEEPAEPDPGETFEPRPVVLENEELKLTFSTRGGVLEEAVLKQQYPTAAARERGAPQLVLLEDFGARLDGAPVHALRLDNLSWPRTRLGSGEWTPERRPDGSLVLTRRVAEAGGGQPPLVAQKVLRLEGHHLRFELSLRYDVEDGERITFPHELVLHTSGGVYQEPYEAVPNSGSYLFSSGGTEEISELVQPRSLGGEEEGARYSFRGDRRFLADVSNYFGAFLALQEGFPDRGRADVHLVPAEQGAEGRSRTRSSYTFETPLEPGKTVSCKGLLYLGPVEDSAILADLGDESPGLAEMLGVVFDEALGWVSPISQAVIWALRRLHGITANWGWAIVLLTLVVRLMLFPINRRSQAAMMHHGEAMSRVKPKLEALKKKYEKDPRKFAQEQMKLMKAEGVSLFPLGGCLPILLQIPIFFGLFSALRHYLSLRQAGWLWVQDLSQPDHLIRFDAPVWNPMSVCGGCCGIPQPDITGLHMLPILMTVTWFLNSYLMPKPATADPQVEQQRKMMMFMPVVFGLMMYSYASALSLYWLTSSTVGIIETRIIKKWFPVKPKTRKPVKRPAGRIKSNRR